MPAVTAMADQPEVICSLKNSDGTHCRKRCTGDKRYRSMIEHVRRVHSEHYIPKLPATEESFQLMLHTPPSDRPQPPRQQTLSQQSPQNSGQRPVASSPLSSIAHLLTTQAGPASDYNNVFHKQPDFTYPGPPPRSSDEYRRSSMLPVGSAAEVLAQLHSHQPQPMAWEQEHGYQQDGFTDTEMGPRLAPIDPPMDPRLYDSERYPDPHQRPPREFLTPNNNRSPPYHRSSTLPPAGRLLGNKPHRPRKSSITQSARKPKHERTKSKDHQRRISYDRKAMSAEPSSLPAVYGKRWEDLIDAAASATEEDRDITPVPASPKQNRSSLPPLLSAPQFQNHGFTGSPLARALTPPPADNHDLQPFPSVESSVDSKQSGHNFHIPSQGLSDSSPQFTSHPVQIYCAGCHRLSSLKDSYACTECICGICRDCVDAISIEKARHRPMACPHCKTYGGRFKPFQLDIR